MTVEAVKHFGANFISSLGAKVVAVAAAAIVSVILARHLGPQAYGQYVTALALGSLLASLTNLGLDKLVLRDVVDDSPQSRQVLASLLLDKIGLVLVGLFLTFLLYGAAQLFLRLEIASLLLWVVLAAIVTGGVNFIRTTMWSRGRVGLSNILQVVEQIILVASVLVLVFHKATLDIIVIGLFLAPMATLLVTLAVWIKNLKPPLFGETTQARARQLLFQALPIGGWAFLSTLYFRIDTLILAMVRPDAEVGWYNVSYTLIQLIGSLAIIFTKLLMPILSRQRKDERAFNELYRRSSAILIVAGFTIAFSLASSGPWLLELVYGNEFAQAGRSLRLFALALPVLFWVQILTTFLLVQYGQNYLLRISAINLVTTTILDVLLIPEWGFIGATVATILAESAGLGLHLYYLRAFVENFSLPPGLVRMAAIGFAILTGIILLPELNIIAMIVSTITFFGCARFTNFVNQTDRKILRTLLQV